MEDAPCTGGSSEDPQPGRGGSRASQQPLPAPCPRCHHRVGDTGHCQGTNSRCCFICHLWSVVVRNCLCSLVSLSGELGLARFWGLADAPVPLELCLEAAAMAPCLGWGAEPSSPNCPGNGPGSADLWCSDFARIKQPWGSLSFPPSRSHLHPGELQVKAVSSLDFSAHQHRVSPLFSLRWVTWAAFFLPCAAALGIVMWS